MNLDDAIQLRRIVGKLARELNASSTDEGLSPAQASILALLGGRGTVSLADLVQMEGINPTMLSRIVGVLQAQGLIERARDPSDLRSATVSITPRGRGVDSTIKSKRVEIVSKGADQLPDSAVDAISKALPALEALVESIREFRT